MAVYVFASYIVYGVFAFLIAMASWAWYDYGAGMFTPADTAFLDAEATLLLAAAAILVIVFEIEKARKERLRGLRLSRTLRRMREKRLGPRTDETRKR